MNCTVNEKSCLKVSVIIPLFNKAETVARAIDSAMMQNDPPHEIIVVDDASTDGSLSTIKRYSDQVIVVRRDKPGPGGYAARNLGVSVATGTHVAFLDADDFWHPEHLAVLKTLLSEYPIFAVSSWIRRSQDRPDAIRGFGALVNNQSAKVLCSTEFVRNMSKGRGIAWTSAVALSRNFFLRIGGFREQPFKRGCDRAFWLRACIHSGSIIASPAATAVYDTSYSTVTKKETIELNGCLKSTVDDLVNSQDVSQDLKQELKKMLQVDQLIQASSLIRRGELQFSHVKKIANNNFFAHLLLLPFLLVPQVYAKKLLQVTISLYRKILNR